MKETTAVIGEDRGCVWFGPRGTRVSDMDRRLICFPVIRQCYGMALQLAVAQVYCRAVAGGEGIGERESTQRVREPMFEFDVSESVITDRLACSSSA